MGTSRKSRITTQVDFQRPGKQQGFLNLPHSVHRSAYGRIAIPVVVLNNGPGPAVLLCAGNHGDEYEGQVALMDLCRRLEPGDMRGRLIILPAANFPAVRAGTRTSPLDAGNLNRAFPGDPDGSPTVAIAHYIDSQLLPQVEVVLDLHSGGSSLRYIPSTLRSDSGDAHLDARSLELQRIFAAPIGYTVKSLGEDRTLGAAARRQGVIYLATEAGGGGEVCPTGVAVVTRGLDRVLGHLGCLPERRPEPLSTASRLLVVGGEEYYVSSPDYGLFEPLVALGAEVSAGQPAARIHCLETPWREPQVVAFQRAGVAFCRRVPGPVERGDCLFQLGSPLLD